MPQLQGVGHREATAELRGGVVSDFLVWLALHFCIAAAGTWLARRYALHRQLIDQPGERRSHTVATPRGGGVAIVAVLLSAAGWLAWHSPGNAPLLGAFALGLLLVAGIGWWDDHRPLSPWLRLAVHVVAGWVLALGVYSATGRWLPALAAWGLVLVLVNVWNFMDGIDGLAASQAAIAAVALTFGLSGPWAWLAAALFAGCLGFLPFNFPRARIFLGDVGSGALGFALAALMAQGLSGQPPGWLLLLPVALFLVDAGFTLASRILAGERWWTPHVTHVYQRAAHRYGHMIVTAAYALLSAVTLLLIYVVSNSGGSAVQLAWVGGWYAVTLALWGWARKGLWQA